MTQYLRYASYTLIAILAGLLIGRVASGGDPPTRPTYEQLQVDDIIEQSILVNQPPDLTNEVMEYITDVKCEDWYGVEDDVMECDYYGMTNPDGITEIATATFDVSEENNPQLLEVVAL